ncbi:MAG: tRNA pseudouridine55 synthase [Actinomycetota bacterium]|nr:tRNA pseudouridine55 synthase [Actinomycetota bacterium]
MTTQVDGLVVVDKPAGWTSHDAVARSRKVFGQKKVGHAGTLDPDATGVLLVGLGRVTRLLRFLTALPKTYTGEVVLGTETSTLDASGDVVATHDMVGVTVEQARAAATALTGDILQVPPMVSAVKVGGQRLHALARKGEVVDREARPVTVHRFDVAEGPEPGVLRVEVQCSSGTYIRVLAADLGHALGGGAHLRNLRRTEVGSFTVEGAVPLEELTADAALSPADALRDYPALTLEGGAVDDVRHGRPVELEAGEGPVALLDAGGALIGVYERSPTGRARAAVVVDPA